jgi:hypothetical protein
MSVLDRAGQAKQKKVCKAGIRMSNRDRLISILTRMAEKNILEHSLRNKQLNTRKKKDDRLLKS